MNLPQVEIFQALVDLVGLPTEFMQPGELETLVTLVASVNPRVMIEIGVNVGRTAKVMLDYFPSLRNYVGVDVMSGYVPALHVQKNEIPMNPGHLAIDYPRFQLIIKQRGSLDLEPINLPQADVVFIDGDHGREALVHDTMLARSVINKDGIIIWHDYNNHIEDVDQFLETEMLSNHDIRHVTNTWLAFERT